MKKKASGNRTPREKKPVDEKSKLFQFRLHPENTDELWAMERIDHYRKNGLSLRHLFVEGLAAYEGRKMPVRSVDVSGTDVLEIKDIVQWIAEKLDSGEWIQAREPKRKTRAAKEINLPDAVRSTLDRYIGGGLTDEDED